MIPSCNTRFAKVKFRLKTTQLETIFNSCPKGKLFRGNCPGGNFMESNCMGGSCLWGNYSRAIVRGQKPGGKCPGGISWGAIVQGVVVQGGIVQG